MSRWITAHLIFMPSLQPLAHMGLMCISKMSEAQYGKLFFPS
jgi:hypothetical protein